MLKYFFLLSLFAPSLSFAQNNAFNAGEKLAFTASYNMSGVLTELAQVNMETSEVKTSKATLLRLKCTATTYSKWDNFFKIRDLYESYVSPTSVKPYLYKRDINEGSYSKFVQYKYNHSKGTAESLIRKKKKGGGTYDQNKTLTISSSTKDIVSTIYYLRTLNLSSFATGKTTTLTMIFDNKPTEIVVAYLGKETISTSIGSKSCYKLGISIKNSNVLKGTNDNLLWLTADENKIPVFAKFKVAVGNGELKIKSATGLKN
ncbi:DUF3108 domain-containing protein [Bizionia arctica]|uniref:DUF3108 domain-containing protein n=1 Tax=Bizionia arctica TaxID=1495645 RepID=A0A917LMY0_9FLAO|nr:DUF3108 domain-containing protein [Bizionia arctica]GGG44073.1 hypothetical protein GCM10010976_14590 [Bizionia arctica]